MYIPRRWGALIRLRPCSLGSLILISAVVIQVDSKYAACRSHDDNWGEGNCSYKVDISTCEPPSYSKAIDSCYVEETWSGGDSTILPTVAPFLEVEVNNLTTAEIPAEFNFEAPKTERCCAHHIGSECVRGSNAEHHGTVNGTWSSNMSYKRQSGYFPTVPCSKQANMTRRACPRVKIVKIHDSYQADMTPECYRVCNLSSVTKEFNQICDDKVFPDTKAREDRAMKDKIKSMEFHRSSLEVWSRENYPLVLETKQVHDCIDEGGWSRRYSMLGFAHDRGGFDKLKLKYGCRLHGCKANQCLQVKKRCPITQMVNSPENSCPVFGDTNTYTCVDKVRFKTENLIMGPVALGCLGCAACFFLCSLTTCMKGTCFANSERVHPSDKFAAMEDESNLLPGDDTLALEAPKPQPQCEDCGEFFHEGEDFCRVCKEKEQNEAQAMPAACPFLNDRGEPCGNVYEEGDTHCSKCGNPRAKPLALTDGTQDSPTLLRATAQTAANEKRIVPVGVDNPPQGFE